MPPLNVAGPYVKAARETHKPPLTQEELAARLQVLGWDIDRFGISRIERGVRQLTDRELLFLAEALSVPATVLLGVDEWGSTRASGKSGSRN